MLVNATVVGSIPTLGNYLRTLGDKHKARRRVSYKSFFLEIMYKSVGGIS